MNQHRGVSGQRSLSPGPIRRWGRCILMVAVLAGCVALILAAPVGIGTSWVAVARTLQTVGAAWWPFLTIVWFAGLAAHATVLKATLPGLSIRRGLSLNLAGSAVGNSLPLGGAMSIGLTTAMTRSWGFSAPAVTAFLTLSSVWNTLSRLLFGCLALTWMLSAGPGIGIGGPSLILAAVLVVAAVAATSALVASDAVLTTIGRTVTTIETAVRSRFRAVAPVREQPEVAGVLLGLRAQLAVTLRRSWPRLVLGMAGYFALLSLLLDLCLRGLGTAPSILLVLATVGIERMVTALPITPGGAGAAELTLVASLTAGGVSPAEALAAALLYRFFTFFAEIPVGVTVALGWHLGRRRHNGSARLRVPRIERAA